MQRRAQLALLRGVFACTLLEMQSMWSTRSSSVVLATMIPQLVHDGVLAVALPYGTPHRSARC